MSDKALVVLSGGQDSTTCLFYAMHHYDEVHAITFNYDQKHSVEIQAAVKVAEMAKVASHEVLELGPVLKGKSPLTDPTQELQKYETVGDLPGGLENTFVPGRNALFLLLAANRAYVHDCKTIITGVCQEDFGGYPDCRDVFIKDMEFAINSALYIDAKQCTEPHIKIVTPLMYLSKAEAIAMAVSLPGCNEALAYSHTCYAGEFPPCGKCHACHLRARGFKEMGLEDPLITRCNKMAQYEEQERNSLG